MLVGRDDEIDALLGVVRAAARGRGGARIVEGEAGIGKTSLLEAVRAAAVDDVPNLRIVRTVGVESELTFAHAGLFDLLRPMLTRPFDASGSSTTRPASRESDSASQKIPRGLVRGGPAGTARGVSRTRNTWSVRSLVSVGTGSR